MTLKWQPLIDLSNRRSNNNSLISYRNKKRSKTLKYKKSSKVTRRSSNLVNQDRLSQPADVKATKIVKAVVDAIITKYAVFVASERPRRSQSMLIAASLILTMKTTLAT